MIMYTMVNATDDGILYQCRCGLKIWSAYPPEQVHHQCPLSPKLAPILTRLAKITNHPEIIDQPNFYTRSAQLWAAGIPGEIEPFEVRDDHEVEFIQGLCRENLCNKYQGGVCKPGCGPGMITEVKARMASEGCVWAWSRW